MLSRCRLTSGTVAAVLARLPSGTSQDADRLSEGVAPMGTISPKSKELQHFCCERAGGVRRGCRVEEKVMYVRRKAKARQSQTRPDSRGQAADALIETPHSSMHGSRDHSHLRHKSKHLLCSATSASSTSAPKASWLSSLQTERSSTLNSRLTAFTPCPRPRTSRVIVCRDQERPRVGSSMVSIPCLSRRREIG